MAYRFGGASSDRAELGSLASLDNQSTWTALLLVRPTTLTTFKTWFDKQASTVGWRIHSPGTGGGLLRVSVYASGGEIAYRTNNRALVANAWQWLAVIVDVGGASNEKINVYTSLVWEPLTECTYDSVADSSGTLSDDSANTVYIANDSSLIDAYPADIALVARWNRVLSRQELWDLQRGPVPSPGCVLFMTFDWKTAFVDQSAYGNHGTNTGAIFSASQELDAYLYPPEPAAVWVKKPIVNTTLSPNLVALLLAGQGTSLGLGIVLPCES